MAQQTVVKEKQESENQDWKMQTGDKFYTIDLSGLTLQELGEILQGKKLAVFPIKNREKDSWPHYKAKGVAMWENTYDPERSAQQNPF